MKSNKTIIDAVIPWVNGNDELWQNKINQHLETKIDFTKKKDSKRYNSIGEIDIAIKSIIKNASFFRTIFLVTDNQIPKSFESLRLIAKQADINLEIVDHKIIFNGFEEYLPTFNSRSIETMLYRIPGLSEHFVIFNDDVFLMRQAKSTDFFIKNHPVIRGDWKLFNDKRLLRKLYLNWLYKLKLKQKKRRDSNKEVMQNSARLIGFNKTYFRRYHTPIAIRKTTVSNIFEEKEILINNIKHRFRDVNQFMISSLTEHFEIKNKTYFKKNTQLTYFRSYKNIFVVKLKLLWFQLNKKKLFMTFQSLELANQKTQDYILAWINKRLD